MQHCWVWRRQLLKIQIMRPLLFLLAIVTLACSCRKDNVKAGKTVEFYLFDSYQLETGKCQVDPSASVLEVTPFVKNEDIIAYSATGYQFKLTEAALQAIKAFGDATPFAVTVDKQVIYYAFFKPNVSSSSCDNSITMDFDLLAVDKISLKLGYPGQIQGVTIDDQRNNPLLIATLKNQGKLE